MYINDKLEAIWGEQSLHKTERTVIRALIKKTVIHIKKNETKEAVDTLTEILNGEYNEDRKHTRDAKFQK